MAVITQQETPSSCVAHAMAAEVPLPATFYHAHPKSYSCVDICLFRLQQYLASARTSIDVCVFTITCDEITRVLLDARQRGVRIRVITDNDQVCTVGPSILQQQMVQLAEARADEQPWWMLRLTVAVFGTAYGTYWNACLISAAC